MQFRNESNAFAVIMAGGRGERFWPASRLSRPKQFLKLLSDRTLLEQTADRLSMLFPPERILVVTNRDYVDEVKRLLPAIPSENILREPEGRDTAPCISWAAARVRRLAEQAHWKDAVLCIVPSDHAIGNVELFRETLQDCMESAHSAQRILTIGIPPSFPCTGYGYIELGEKLPSERNTPFYHGLGFREKPDLKTAEEYLQSGRYRWNSGIFVAALSFLENAFRTLCPELWMFYQEISTFERNPEGRDFAELYAKAPKISIDYAVMEKTPGLVTADGSFGWDDVGSWPALRARLSPDAQGNVVKGLFASVDSRNCIVSSDDKDHLIAAVGLQNTIIIHTDDVTFVCAEESAPQVKRLLAQLKENGEWKKFL